MFWCIFTILVHLGPFGWLLKLGAKRDELVQKFVPQNCVIIFRNELTRLTPLGPMLMFWCVLCYLGAFGTVWLPYKTRCKTSRSRAKFRAMKSCQNFSQQTTRSTQLDPNLMFRWVLYSLGAFGTVWLRYNTLCKSAKLGQKFVPRSLVGIFRNERTRSTPLDSKHIFWCLLYYSNAFGTVWLPYKT